MSGVEVVFTDEAKADVLALDRSVQIVVFKALKKLESSPEQRGAPLGAGLTTFRKLVVGDRQFRVVFRVEDGGVVVVVHVVAARSDGECYRLANERLAALGDVPGARAARVVLEQGRRVPSVFVPGQ